MLDRQAEEPGKKRDSEVTCSWSVFEEKKGQVSTFNKSSLAGLVGKIGVIYKKTGFVKTKINLRDPGERTCPQDFLVWLVTLGEINSLIILRNGFWLVQYRWSCFPR
jgi:hypothetical protein